MDAHPLCEPRPQPDRTGGPLWDPARAALLALRCVME